jgi:pimeloyl-ACP methyl ester carboxylesterase
MMEEAQGENHMSVTIECKTCISEDGVSIVYSGAGAGEPALLFIHGGLAERGFWMDQINAFAGSHRVIALDLPGHGESGANREDWSLPRFGADVSAVIGVERIERVILFGNSLGGPVAVEAALLLPKQVLGVVGVDTFHRLDYVFPPEEARRRAEAFRDDYSGSIRQMVRELFHKDADPALVAHAGQRMQKSPPAAAYAMFMGLAGYDVAASARGLAVPLRAINGDLYPTDIDGVRKIKADFAAFVMKHVGHYPMLERPDEFNVHVAAVVAELDKR